MSAIYLNKGQIVRFEGEIFKVLYQSENLNFTLIEDESRLFKVPTNKLTL